MKKLLCMLTAVMMMLVAYPNNGALADDDDPFEQTNEILVNLSGAMLDGLFAVYDKSGDDSAAFVVLVHYYYEAYDALNDVGTAYSTYRLSSLLKALGSGDSDGDDEMAKMLPKTKMTMSKASVTAWEQYLDGETDGKTYLEFIRGLYEIKKGTDD